MWADIIKSERWPARLGPNAAGAMILSNYNDMNEYIQRLRQNIKTNKQWNSNPQDIEQIKKHCESIIALIEQNN